MASGMLPRRICTSAICSHDVGHLGVFGEDLAIDRDGRVELQSTGEIRGLPISLEDLHLVFRVGELVARKRQ